MTCGITGYSIMLCYRNVLADALADRYKSIFLAIGGFGGITREAVYYGV